jgi:hypothetical protein
MNVRRAAPAAPEHVMNSNLNTVTIWQSGKLAPHIAPHGVKFGRERWLGAALLVLSAIVMALFVVVLEKDVARSAMQHETQRSHAVAEALLTAR